MRESAIEAFAVKYAKGKGWLTYKFVSPNQRGVPDRVFIRQGTILFIEFKAPGKQPTALQQKTIQQMRDEGATVLIVGNYEDAANALA